MIVWSPNLCKKDHCLTTWQTSQHDRACLVQFSSFRLLSASQINDQISRTDKRPVLSMNIKPHNHMPVHTPLFYFTALCEVSFYDTRILFCKKPVVRHQHLKWRKNYATIHLRNWVLRRPSLSEAKDDFLSLFDESLVHSAAQSQNFGAKTASDTGANITVLRVAHSFSHVVKSAKRPN